MSIVTEMTRIQTDRNTIRAKLVELGMAQSTDGLDKLATAVESIENRGAVSATVQEGDTYTIPKGYHNGGGTVSGAPGEKKEWKLLIDKTLEGDEAINTGSLSDVTEMLFLYAAPATEPVISSGTATKVFGGWAPYYVNLTHAAHPTSGMIYGMKVGGSAISFYRFHQTTAMGIGNAPRAAANVQCSQTDAATDVPFTSAALPAGTIIRLYVK